MKKRWQIFLYLLLYIFLLAFVLGFDVKRLIDGKGLFVLLTGSFLLTLPFYHRGMEKGEFLYLFGRKSIEAGLVQTFLLLFIRLSDAKGSEGLLPDIALCFRTMLYAFCVQFTFAGKETKGRQESGFGDFGDGKEAHAPEITYDNCIAAGLTKLEAEIALLVCRGCSNAMIAEELVISETTVKKHISNIFEKTGIRKREELRAYLARYSAAD